MTELLLSFDIHFDDLYTNEGLMKLDQLFIKDLQQKNLQLAGSLLYFRKNYVALSLKEKSSLILELSTYIENFIGKVFNISEQMQHLKQSYENYSPVAEAKKLFIQRHVAKNLDPSLIKEIDLKDLNDKIILLLGPHWTELTFAQKALDCLKDEEENKIALDLLTLYAQWALISKEGQEKHKEEAFFRIPQKLNFDHLIHGNQNECGDYQADATSLRQREGFKLTDQGPNLSYISGQAHYCIFCHHQGKDSCSKGYKVKNTLEFQKNPLGITLTGCPLEEKISEMNQSVSEGFILGALAIAMIDNPLLPLTGHRICNDCLKSCIYQKQEPVNIPAIETRILKDVLNLPWGVEIYSLLTRWNPLNFERPLPKSLTGHKVLVSGMGPAGINLSHHLLNEGHAVVGIDGLKIEPLPEEISGITIHGERRAFKPVFSWAELTEELDERVIGGFGGVAEYGITVRWNKNFLKLVRLILERRSHFLLLGGIRFGGTLTPQSAFDLGFDHIALAMGAGKPKLVPLKNNLTKGVRMASDFLMALQLTGAARKESLANLQIRLPIVVIGGGLTAIDTATEALAYYPLQVEKFLSRYEMLCLAIGQEEVEKNWTKEDHEIADEFITHAKALRKEKTQAKKEDRTPNTLKLLQEWGGSSIIYRRRLQESPSYTLNHEEVSKALEEGIIFKENLTPIEIVTDHYNAASALRVRKEDKIIDLTAKTILIAAGTQPNTVLASESALVKREGFYFEAYDINNNHSNPEKTSKPRKIDIFTGTYKDGRRLSFFGDLHPSFAGNVVKAMASAKQGYPLISQHLSQRTPTAVSYKELFNKLNKGLRAFVYAVKRLTPSIVEVILKAPLAAQGFQPGQFYRLQNFEAYALQKENTTFGMEGIALTGSWVDKENGLISTIVLEMGGSSSLCTYLNPKEPVILMGPTGTPTEIPSKENVLLVGGGLGNAVLFSIGQALRQNNCKVLYVAGYKKLEDRYKTEEIEKAADYILWASDEKPGFKPSRPQDLSYAGNIVQALEAYAKGDLGDQPIPLSEIDRIIVIGSDQMMHAVQKARHTVLKTFLNPKHEALGSINSPMQCMMKEICAQCIQRHIDPVTGEESYVFSCTNQDQKLDYVDFTHLKARLNQNSLSENLTTSWIQYLNQKEKYTLIKVKN